MGNEYSLVSYGLGKNTWEQKDSIYSSPSRQSHEMPHCNDTTVVLQLCGYTWPKYTKLQKPQSVWVRQKEKHTGSIYCSNTSFTITHNKNHSSVSQSQCEKGWTYFKRPAPRTFPEQTEGGEGVWKKITIASLYPSQIQQPIQNPNKRCPDQTKPSFRFFLTSHRTCIYDRIRPTTRPPDLF